MQSPECGPESTQQLPELIENDKVSQEMPEAVADKPDDLQR